MSDSNDCSGGTCIQGRKLPFEIALMRLKEGYPAIALEGWTRSVVKMQVPDEHSKMTYPYLYIEYTEELDGSTTRHPWVPNAYELFSKDWEIRVQL